MRRSRREGSGVGRMTGQLLLLALDVAGAVAVGVVLARWARRRILRRKARAWLPLMRIVAAHPDLLRSIGGL